MNQPSELKIAFKIKDLPQSSKILPEYIDHEIYFFKKSNKLFQVELSSAIFSIHHVLYDLEFLGADPVVKIYVSTSTAEEIEATSYFIADKNIFGLKYEETDTGPVVRAMNQGMVAFTFEDLSKKYVIEISPRSKINMVVYY